ncbi:MAG TPA: cyclopropane-fatty-acyl-phospholipid synthase family protein [Baekduia sp.]|nr:cyclopropane-fatty-acyl-phospholipid synthase family protein [Baekduia sp.]
MAILSNPEQLRHEIEAALPDRPFAIEWWDGARTDATSDSGLVFRVRSPKALGHALRAPGQLGIGRAYVSGELEPNDMDLAVDLLQQWKPPAIDGETKRKLMLAAAKAHGLQPPPKPPKAELRPKGKRHSRERDERAVRHHYDLSNEFFELFLGPGMTYSCAIFSRGAQTLEEAQFHKLELVCRKLGLKAGERVLDIGCGWGSFAVHAAKHHGAKVTGITVSPPQAERARRRAEEEGVADLVDIRIMDYRELGGETFDAISSIGMVEHVGSVRIDEYAHLLASLLGPGGRLLNHGIGRIRHNDPEAGAFSERYVFPDGAPLHLSRVQVALERAGFITDTVEGFQYDYAETLKHWYENLDADIERARVLAGDERLRVWRLYLRTARQGFLSGFIGIWQVLAHTPPAPGERPVAPAVHTID